MEGSSQHDDDDDDDDDDNAYSEAGKCPPPCTSFADSKRAL
jgi:hypothetical protein